MKHFLEHHNSMTIEFAVNRIERYRVQEFETLEIGKSTRENIYLLPIYYYKKNLDFNVKRPVLSCVQTVWK